MNKMDKYMAVLFVSVIVFTAIMIGLFIAYQSVPDTLIGSVFGLAFGECGVMGLIKRAKERRRPGDDDTEGEANG